ncbi:uncharacterized protein LOC144640614 [Oculina patagonica]
MLNTAFPDKETLKAFKSLHGYRLFADGHVEDLLFHPLKGKKYCLFKFSVKPTEKSKTQDGKKVYNGWIVMKEDGEVFSGYCNCQGGLDGGCRHLAAALFDIETTVRQNSAETCTTGKCLWNKRSSKNASTVRLKDLQLSKEEYGKDPKQYPSPHFTKFDPRPTYMVNEKTTLFDALRSSVPSAGIISWAPKVEGVQYSSEQVAQHISNDINVQHWEQVDDNVTLHTVIELGEMFVNEKEMDLKKPEDLTEESCKEFIHFIQFGKEQRDMLHDKTIGQVTNSLWMQHRAGRITASNVYKICHLRDSTDPKATIKLLMNYHPTVQENMPAPLEWGHLKEVSAKELYLKKMSSKHGDFTMMECGLAVSEEQPFLGASPDGFCYCSCCGKRLVEVKSIYSKKNLKPSIAAGDKIIYDSERSKWILKKETTWYYQVQCQMAVTKIHVTDLVIYTNKGILIISVPFDARFWLDVKSKLEKFYLRNMIPEILFGAISKEMP